jgi:hypothetical protein
MAKPTPPVWAPDAIATEKGWVDSKTGELLLAIDGLVKPKKAVVAEESTQEDTPANE